MTRAAAKIEPTELLDVARRLRAARAKIGMTRKQLATLSGTSERYLAQIEAGGGNPSLSVLTALAQALDLAVAELLPLGGERNEAYASAAATVRRLPEGQLAVLGKWLDSGLGTGGGKDGRIVLLGLRGAGKTALGKALADRLQLPFVEMSKQVEDAYGADMGLLIELSGQAALRRYEAEVWENIRSEHGAAVIAAPGGIVADGPLYDRIIGTAHTIWLQARPEDHMERVMAQGDFRPMASNRAAMDDLRAILEARTPDYARADTALDTSAQDFQATVGLLERQASRLLESGEL